MQIQELQSIKARFGIIGNSPALNHAIEVAGQVAPFEAWWPHDKLAVRGYFEVLSHYREISGIRNQLADRLLHADRKDRPDLFIGVDAPDFNLDLEARIKAQGIKTLKQENR